MSSEAPETSTPEASTDDAHLVDQAQRGDQHAFQELVARHQQRAYAVALGVLRNPDDAKDVVQEGFIKAYRNLDRFQGQSSFYTWIYRIMMNAAIDHLRRRRSRSRETVGFDDRLAHEDPDDNNAILPQLLEANPAKNLGRHELAAQMNQALGQLSPDHRAILVMREVEGMSYKDMAKTMRCAKGTVMSRLFHARRHMQKLMLGYLGDGGLESFE